MSAGEHILVVVVVVEEQQIHWWASEHSTVVDQAGGVLKKRPLDWPKSGSPSCHQQPEGRSSATCSVTGCSMPAATWEHISRLPRGLRHVSVTTNSGSQSPTGSRPCVTVFVVVSVAVMVVLVATACLQQMQGRPVVQGCAAVPAGGSLKKRYDEMPLGAWPSCHQHPAGLSSAVCSTMS